MMGIPVSVASYIYGDSMSVINNTSKPELTLKKKCKATHSVGKFVTMGETLTEHIRSEDNPADILPSGVNIDIFCH